MICEICGTKDIKGYKVLVEGTSLNACSSCSKGKEILSSFDETRKSKPKPKKKKDKIFKDKDLPKEDPPKKKEFVNVKKPQK
jgi:ribosome-binding protein aMBF1 (putative translation factor)